MISNQNGKVTKGGNSKKEPKTIKTTTKTVTSQPKQSDLENEQKVVKYTLRNGKMEEITAAFEKHVSVKDNEEEKTAEASPFDSTYKYNFKIETKEGCVFCNIFNLQKHKILYEDKLCFAFYDKRKKSSKEHILICPVTHIKNPHTVKESEIPLLSHMEQIGHALLGKMFPQDNYRFGYHEPPMNSVNHLHLHCLVLPLTKPFFDQYIYGSCLASTETIINKAKERSRKEETKASKL